MCIRDRRWSDAERGAFEEIKRKFSEMSMMNHPDFEKVFYLQTDASNVAVGAELYQGDEEKEHLTIAFASSCLLYTSRCV